MKPTDANRPLRVFDKVIQGGLGAGNLGLVMSRHGTGKIAVLTSIAIDHAMDGRNVLHVAVGANVSDIRAYDDEVMEEILNSLDLRQSIEHRTLVERHKQIYTYRDGAFSPARLQETLRFLADHAEFRPEMIELQGWPDFNRVTVEEMQALKETAQQSEAEIWLTAHTKRDDSTDSRGVPAYVAQHEKVISVLVALEEAPTHVNLRFIKTHDKSPSQGVHLEFDPQTMLIRWR